MLTRILEGKKTAYITGWHVNQCSHHGKQYKNSSKDQKSKRRLSLRWNVYPCSLRSRLEQNLSSLLIVFLCFQKSNGKQSLQVLATALVGFSQKKNLRSSGHTGLLGIQESPLQRKGPEAIHAETTPWIRSRGKPGTCPDKQLAIPFSSHTLASCTTSQKECSCCFACLLVSLSMPLLARVMILPESTLVSLDLGVIIFLHL